jgi:hypothetical protein
MLDTLRTDGTITDWLVHSEVAKDANLLNELPHNNPEEGWSIILKVLHLPESQMHLPALSDCLKSLFIHHGEEFIERIEAQAVNDSRFKACLAQIHLHPGTHVPSQLWERLTNAAGIPAERVASSLERALVQIPDLSEALYASPILSEPKDIVYFLFTDSDLERIAHNWIKHQETFWALKKINHIISDEFIEYAYNVVKILYEKSSSDVHLSSIGAGPLTDLLEKNGAFIIDRVEKLASTDRRFRICLSYVWPTKIEVDLWKRIAKARDGEPQRG